MTYASKNFGVVRKAIHPQLTNYLQHYAEILRATGRFEDDHQVPGSLRRYGAPGFDALLPTLLPAFESAAGIALTATYSFVRIYFRGQELVAHKDRSECQHSATLHLASSDGRPWPIYVRDGESAVQEFDLAPGDALLYRGDRVLHWREPLQADWYVQVFLHYIMANGSGPGVALDGREHLGLRSLER